MEHAYSSDSFCAIILFLKIFLTHQCFSFLPFLPFAMKKSFNSPSSRYWVFRTPIFPEWVPSNDSRVQIEQAARGSGDLPENCLDELRRTVRGRKKWKRWKVFMITI